MSRLWLAAAALLLSSIWVVAQPTEQDPTSGTAPATHRRSHRADSDQPARVVEGCLSSIDDAFTLTDANGKTYQVTGDTAQLTARAGNTVRLWGHSDSILEAESITAGGPHAAFNVQKAQSLSAGCKTS